MIKMFKMIYENGEIFPVFNEEQFHENEKKEMFEQGIIKGIEQGRKENCLSIARNLKHYGFSNDKIVKLTNLSEEQVMML